MNYPLTIRKEAEDDIRKAFKYYESCREGLGHEFLLCIEAALENIQRHPFLSRMIHKNILCKMIHRFPYGVYFIVKEKRIVVIAVMHARRHPSHWQSRH